MRSMLLQRFVGMVAVLGICCALGLVGGVAVRAAEIKKRGEEKLSVEALEFFEGKVRPLLVKYCHECHAHDARKIRGGLLLDSRDGWAKGGDSGPAVVPGSLEKSLLIEAVRYKNRDMQMPPKRKLDAAEVAVFEKWVKMGAPDPRKGKAGGPKKRVIDIEKGRKFWSFMPLRVEKIDRLKDEGWAWSEIDRYILARLEAKGLRPASDTDRRTLIRRLYFDLIGLPPTPSDIEAFVKDESKDAYAKVVDRLLGSKDYGERWGRHWLDVARFAESSGGGRSLMFRNAWRYRDYVIDAYNKDKRFDDFIQEQIAGDLLESKTAEERNERMVATGYLALGPTNYEQQDKGLLRMEVVDEQIDTMGRTFLGMTLGCAKCHEHKFDPIPARDYYALAGIFRSTKVLTPGNVSGYVEKTLQVSGPRKAAYDQYKADERALAGLVNSLKKEIARLSKRKKAAIVKGKRHPRPLPVTGLVGVVVDESKAKRVGPWKHSTYSSNHIGRGYIHDQKMNKGGSKVVFTPALPREGMYEVRIAYNHGASRAARVPVEIRHAGGVKKIFVNQQAAPPIDGLMTSLGRYEFKVGMGHGVSVSNKGTNGFVIVDAVQFLEVKVKLGVNGVAKGTTKIQTATSDNALRKAQAADEVRRLLKLDGLKNDLRKLEAELKAMRRKAPTLGKAMTVDESPDAGDWHIHIRGQIRVLGPKVKRGFLTVATPGAPKAGADATIGKGESGRIQLAEWLVRRDHPLTSRVYVNRVWLHLLGKGIVPTPDNFGTMGRPPSHPKLLDYLATKFMDDGWSTKKLVRAIVMSRVYRLSTQAEESLKKGDPENDLFGRAERRRLEAEAIRDAILLISGKLDRKRGGLTIRKFTQYDNGYAFNTVRRSVYVPMFRNSLLELFDVFDVANPNLVVGKRVASTRPTQALYLMNSPFVMEQARAAAERLLKLKDLADDERLDRLYEMAVGRKPMTKERELTLKYLAQERETGEGGSDTRILQAWANVCQSVFASLDFRYLN